VFAHSPSIAVVATLWLLAAFSVATWALIVAKAVQFGMVHALIGIPLGVALALSIGGGYFQWCYLRGFRRTGSQEETVLESTRAHVAYNGLLQVVVVAAIAAVAAGL
jgi:hypothetical protein